ncbi:MAG: hypothetical protein AAGJ18_21585 [Bacteroidota bacterium]
MAKKKSKNSKKKEMSWMDKLKAKVTLPQALSFGAGGAATVFGLAGLKKAAAKLVKDGDETKVQRAAGTVATGLGLAGVVFGGEILQSAGAGMAGGGVLTVADSYLGDTAEDLADRGENLLTPTQDDPPVTTRELNLLLAASSQNNSVVVEKRRAI